MGNWWRLCDSTQFPSQWVRSGPARAGLALPEQLLPFTWASWRCRKANEADQKWGGRWARISWFLSFHTKNLLYFLIYKVIKDVHVVLVLPQVMHLPNDSSSSKQHWIYFQYTTWEKIGLFIYFLSLFLKGCLLLEWQTTNKPWDFVKTVDKHLLSLKHF